MTSLESQEKHGSFPFKLKAEAEVEGIKCEKLLDINLKSGTSMESAFNHILFLYQPCGCLKIRHLNQL